MNRWWCVVMTLAIAPLLRPTPPLRAQPPRYFDPPGAASGTNADGSRRTESDAAPAATGVAVRMTDFDRADPPTPSLHRLTAAYRREQPPVPPTASEDGVRGDFPELPPDPYEDDEEPLPPLEEDTGPARRFVLVRPRRRPPELAAGV